MDKAVEVEAVKDHAAVVVNSMVKDHEKVNSNLK